MTDRMKAWQCIGCGKIDGPQPCVGICQDRKVELVYAGSYDLLAARVEALEALMGLLARTTPRDGEWERSYRSMQERARKFLATSPARRI